MLEHLGADHYVEQIVFEVQLEALQDADRFYYLSRLANLNLTAQMENNKFSDIIHRNTDATHLPGDVFATPDFFIEADQSKQFNAGLGSADPTEGGDLILSGLTLEQMRWIEATYETRGLALAGRITRGNWATLVFSRPKKRKRPGGRTPGRLLIAGSQGAGWELDR